MDHKYAEVIVPGRPQARRLKEDLPALMREACPAPLRGMLELEVVCLFQRPYSWDPELIRQIDHGAEFCRSGTPTLPSLVAVVIKAGTGILWNGLGQIVRIRAYAVYAAENETSIDVFTVEDTDA